MHWKRLLGWVTFWSVVGMVFIPLALAEPLKMPGDYRMGPGDVLEISVWKNQELTRQVTVLPGGKISFPLLGELMVANRTAAELRGELEQKISKFMREPNISVLVQQVNSMLVYIIGKVNRPGRLVLNDDINVLQALSMAGGLATYAKPGKIKIFRKGPAKTAIFTFDYDEVSKGENLDQNIVLERGDVIVVP